jgi:uncharacterized membrane protein
LARRGRGGTRRSGSGGRRRPGRSAGRPARAQQASRRAHGVPGRAAAAGGPDRGAGDLNRALATTLRTGVIASAVLIAGGFLLQVARGGGAVQAAAGATQPAAILAGVVALQPPAIINLGLCLLILTPVAVAVVSFLRFLRERNRGMAGAAGVVLAALLVSFALGRAHG